MKKAKKRFLSALLACAMLISLFPFAAFAGTTHDVTSFNDLKNVASTAATGDVVNVSGKIEMTEPITFTNAVTLNLTENASIQYSSDTCSQLYLITLQDGSTFNMAEGSSIVMDGDAGSQNANRDWRAVYSKGSLKCATLAGDITVNNARGRGLYANNDLTVGEMSGNITMYNPNGDNRYLYGIVSYAGNVNIGTLSGTVSLYYGGGNSAYGIAAQTGSVTISNLSGTINVQLGTSHNSFGIYAQSNVTVTGDISGKVYARGASATGYGVCAATGDVSIAKISGSVTGDCYNEVMNNSQSDASALYAGRSIYGSNQETPIALTGTLSSTVGRNDAFTVQAKGNINISIDDTGSIKAQSSYGAAWSLNGTSYAAMSNNWGGAAAGVIANGTINIIGADKISVISQDDKGNPIEAGYLAETAKADSANNISTFLYCVASGQNEAAEEANNKLTDDEKAAINDYEDLVDKMHTITVRSMDELNKALDNAEDGTTISLQSGVYEGTITINKSVENLTIEGTEGAVIKNGSLTVASNGIQLPGLTIQNLTFTNANIQMSPNGNSDLSGMTIKDNTFTGTTNGNSAVHLNFGSTTGSNSGAKYDGLTITGNTIKDITTGSNSGILIVGDGATESDLTIDNNLIDGVAWNGIQLNNIKGDTIAVTNNEIKNCGANGDGVLNLYNTTGESFKINENKIYPAEGQLYVSNISGNVDLNDNYWGTARPDFETGLAYKEGYTTPVEVDEYYKAPTMQEEDLNTYEPPYTGKYSYEITVADTDNGTVSVDKYATEGEDVTITVTPDKGYKLDELTVTAGSKDVDVKDNGNGTLTFTMPSSKVKVAATFVEDENYDDSITISMTVGSNDFVINDTIVTIPDAAPYIANSRTYVPFRALGEAIGADVVWDNDARTVTYTLDGNEIVMTIGSTTYTVNGVEKTMDVAPEITGERTYVPIRFIGEALGFKVTPLYAEDGTTASVVFEK